MSKVKTEDIDCKGYSVKADIYEGTKNDHILLSLIGRTSKRTKQRYFDFLPKIAKDLGITAVIFDYTGHGDSPYNIEDLSPAQHFLEVITVFDWIRNKYPKRKIIVIGSSYGGFLATQLTKYRKFEGLILRAPAIYRPIDFYTLKKNEDREATQSFRKDTVALSKHPLFTTAASFGGKTLLVVHERDEQIPIATTDAYAKALKGDLVTFNVSHSLDQATADEIDEYNNAVLDWIKKLIEKESDEN